VYFSPSWKFQNFVSSCTKMKTKFAIFSLFLHKWRQPITWSLKLAKAKLHHKDDILRSFNSCKFEHKLSWEHENWVWDHLTHEISSQAKVDPETLLYSWNFKHKLSWRVKTILRWAWDSFWVIKLWAQAKVEHRDDLEIIWLVYCYLLQNPKVTQPDDGPSATKIVVKMHWTCKVREGVKCVENSALGLWRAWKYVLQWQHFTITLFT
jgi:hypothetical protein